MPVYCLEIRANLCIMFFVEFIDCFQLYYDVSGDQEIELVNADIFARAIYPDLFSDSNDSSCNGSSIANALW